MNVIKIMEFAFRIPELPARYRANCSKEWGMFVTGDTKRMTASQAEKNGLTRGSFVDLALCWVDHKKILTFLPNYINEPFTEIWGIPVGGEMKDRFHEKCSELSTFLIHRQSKDRMRGLVEIFSRDAFNQWVAEGMQGDCANYAIAKAADAYFSNVFRFEFVSASSPKGDYFFIQTSYRAPASDLEFAALKAAEQVYHAQIEGTGYCTDRVLEENHRNCVALLGGSPAVEQFLPAGEAPVNVSTNAKQAKVK